MQFWGGGWSAKWKESNHGGNKRKCWQEVKMGPGTVNGDFTIGDGQRQAPLDGQGVGESCLINGPHPVLCATIREWGSDGKVGTQPG